MLAGDVVERSMHRRAPGTQAIITGGSELEKSE